VRRGERGRNGADLDLEVQISELGDRVAWLSVVAHAPFGADVSLLGSEIREHALTALAEAELLPA